MRSFTVIYITVIINELVCMLTKDIALFYTVYNTTVVHKVGSGGLRSFSRNEIFLEMSQDLGLQQIVDFPTHGTSLLELFITNKPDLVNNCELLIGVGDHDTVTIENYVGLHINN